MTVRAVCAHAIAGLMLAACAASPAGLAPPAASSMGGGPAPDASYDWHGLQRAPFGLRLKDSPVALHEVLLFRDVDRGGAAESGPAESKDCYAVDGAAPRFLGSLPDEYLLCFQHDRLTRIEVSVRLPAGEAPQVLARGCALWLQSAPPPVERDDGVDFSARLAANPGESESRVSMTLTGVPDAETVRDPQRAAPREPGPPRTP